MSSIESHLMDGEAVLHRARLHPIVLSFCASYVACALASAAVSFYLRSAWPVLFGALPLAMCVPAWLDYRCSEFAVTERRLIVKRGWLTTRTNEALLTKLGTIGVEQGLLGRALGFGCVYVKGPGGAQEVLESIADPILFSRAIQGQMVRLEQKPAPKAAGSLQPPFPVPETLDAARFNVQVLTA